ncbi:hypothetical protein NDI43_21190 [Microcoleus vaginatus GB2-A3]|uniref:hypothetical protein n=1 Tax=Microcoleus vaginatus TaxID=119532 RepID=UPI0032A35470
MEGRRKFGNGLFNGCNGWKEEGRRKKEEGRRKNKNPEQKYYNYLTGPPMGDRPRSINF